ncbi:hypothetical protein LTR37_004214 [Vermiconidia calcicola]|uniref:Uncharacterized protein n=1 Tax=Vermiconidia calcicola TaxID=1690605 RepID=A0ACC3NN16_9PEZI|nr:hypothetical protein LTR37_004214 [Vermiconidia calcicola]
MEHVDGIAVSIQRPRGAQQRRYKAYDNPLAIAPKYLRHRFGSRLVSAHAGETIQVIVNFSRVFDLFSAEGLIINISNGSTTDLLVYPDNNQCFWIEASELKRERRYEFTAFAVSDIEDAVEPTRDLLLRMPSAQPEGATAEKDADYFAADKGCVSVDVARCKKNPTDHVGVRKNIADPPEAWRYMAMGMPKPIHGHWVRPLSAYTGAEYIFEFRNAGADAFDATQPEAVPRIGSEADLFDSDEIAYEMEYQTRSGRTSRKRKRLASLGGVQVRPVRASNAASTQSNDTCVQDGESGPSAYAGPSRQTNSARDDSEELPTGVEQGVKEDIGSERESSRTQEPTPPPETVPDHAIITGRDRDVKAPSPARAEAITAIDLTGDDDDEPSVKVERTVRNMEFEHSFRDVADSEDEDALYRLRQAEIRRDFALEQLDIERDRARKKRRSGRGGSGTPQGGVTG